MSPADETYDDFQSWLDWMDRLFDQQTPGEIAEKLKAAGFIVPSTHPLVAVDGSVQDPRNDSFKVVNAGGCHMALYREYGRFYMQITEGDGDAFDLERWQNNVIGIYDLATDDELTCVSARKWQQVIDAAAG